MNIMSVVLYALLGLVLFILFVPVLLEIAFGLLEQFFELPRKTKGTVLAVMAFGVIVVLAAFCR